MIIRVRRIDKLGSPPQNLICIPRTDPNELTAKSSIKGCVCFGVKFLIHVDKFDAKDCYEATHGASKDRERMTIKSLRCEQPYEKCRRNLKGQGKLDRS